MLYLDCDLVVNRDIAELYSHKLTEQYLLGAIHDFEVIRLATKDKNWGVSYLNNFLGLKNTSYYFQSGVLLMNISQMRKENIYEKLLDTLEKIKTPKFVDQCIFNIVCEDRVLFLDPRWNVEFHIPIWAPDWIQTMPVSILYDYIESRENPWIIHFAGSKKPWQNASLEMSEYFWKYAIHSPYYHEILYGNLRVNPVQNIVQHIEKVADLSVIREIKKYSHNHLKYLRYKLLSKITFGKTRQHYKRKKRELKQRLKAVKQFLKGK